MTRLDIAATIPTARITPARIHNAVAVPTQVTRKTISVSTPMTMRGKPMETDTPTCLMGLKLVDPLFLREPSFIAPPLRSRKDLYLRLQGPSVMAPSSRQATRVPVAEG